MSIIFSPFPMYLFFKGNKIPVYSLVMVLFHVSHRILQGDYTYYDDAPEDILLRPPPHQQVSSTRKMRYIFR